jgi:hypothetical protein
MVGMKTWQVLAIADRAETEDLRQGLGYRVAEPAIVSDPIH